MTEQQLSELEQLLKARDEARKRYESAVLIGYEVADSRRQSAAQSLVDSNRKLECSLGDAAPALLAEVRRLRGVVAQHDLCHDLHGKVGAEDFAKGCAAEQRRLYGCAPDTDRVAALEARLADVLRTLGKHTGPCYAELLCEGCLNTRDTLTKELYGGRAISAG